jgi:hypothetical protein
MARPSLSNSDVAADEATQLNTRRYSDSELRNEVVELHFDVPGNFAHKRRRDVSTLVKRDWTSLRTLVLGGGGGPVDPPRTCLRKGAKMPR